VPLQQTPTVQSKVVLQLPLLHLFGGPSGVGVGVLVPVVLGVDVVTSEGVGVVTSDGVGVVAPLVAGVGVLGDGEDVHLPGGRSQPALLSQFIGGGV